MFTAVTGVSGSGKSSLVSQSWSRRCGPARVSVHESGDEDDADATRGQRRDAGGEIVGGMDGIKRLVRVDQKPIGRTPRSNLATYTGLFDHVRKLFAATKAARARRYDAGRFSFNVAKGRCETCEGEGFVIVELLFLPSVYAPCPTCNGARYNAKTLEVQIRDKTIADVLGMTVDARASSLPTTRRCGARSTCCARSGSATCASGSRRPSCPAAKRSASSSRPSCSARSAAKRSTSSTSRRPACTRPTSRS